MDVDYRGAAVAALLPDLIDKPVSLTVMARSGTSQGLSHTLVAQTLLTLATAHAKPEWRSYALISNSHLLADQMWKYPYTLFFPFSGKFDTWKFMGTPSAMLSAYAEIATRPAIVAVEAVGVALLAWVAHKGQWHRKGSLRRLLSTGRTATEAARPLPEGTRMSQEVKVAECG
jgi:hypothetical protein